MDKYPTDCHDSLNTVITQEIIRCVLAERNWDNLKGFNDFCLKIAQARPESGRVCVMCAEFTMDKYPTDYHGSISTVITQEIMSFLPQSETMNSTYNYQSKNAHHVIRSRS